MNITEKIQQLRKEKGWTITRLAQETNIPTVSLRVMLSRQDPNGYTVKNLVKLAAALGVTVSCLTMDEGEKEPPILSAAQREEIKALVCKAIDDYFAVPSQEAESAGPVMPRPVSIKEIED